MTYKEKFKDPRWQKLRLKILNRDNFTCQFCEDKETTLHIHHRYYKKDTDPWDYPEESLITLCEECHEEESEYRYAMEQALLFACKEKLLWSAIERLSIAIHKINTKHPVEDLIGAVAWVLENPELQEPIIKKHKTWCDKKLQEVCK